MKHLNTSASFSPNLNDAGSRDPFVTLKEDKLPNNTDAVGIYQVYRMFMRAMDGIPAGTYRTEGCPVEFDGDMIHIWLDFYAYPSDPSLVYELSSTIGEINTPETVHEPKEFDALFTLSDTYDLYFYAEQFSLDWQIPCYIKDCEIVDAPDYNLQGHTIALDTPVFSVARVNATAYMKKYRLDINILKGDNRITGLSPVITASWQNAEGETLTEQLTLPLPKCVEFALGMCKGDLGNTWCAIYQPPRIIYYSICDGSVVKVKVADPETICAKKVI